MSEIGVQYAKIVEAKKYSFLILTYFLGGTFLSAFVAWQLHNPGILLVGFLIFGICPIIFKKYYRRPFVKKVSVECSDSYFEVNVFDSKKDEVVSTHKYFYNEINSYRTFESTTERSSQLKIWPREGGSVNYIFVEENYGEGDSLLSIIVKRIMGYNEISYPENKISLKKSLFATNIGTYIIILLVIGWICLLIFQIAYKQKSIPLSVIGGIMLFLQLLIQRKKDIATYEANK
ncbi:hypothetical protein [Pedobacter cryoconitis]|uniref:Uncharacterized protein n=1 Tax=Pedobacter cryoconitis TaxID=188932 RepID=A0A327RX26_9SPHI|nr:hypothetical protein [Pedobacter cryoconitis]RAJ21005.1 hypothetical protein LY11_05055 [Pedobacter cryoconitis]